MKKRVFLGVVSICLGFPSVQATGGLVEDLEKEEASADASPIPTGVPSAVSPEVLDEDEESDDLPTPTQQDLPRFPEVRPTAPEEILRDLCGLLGIDQGRESPRTGLRTMIGRLSATSSTLKAAVRRVDEKAGPVAYDDGDAPEDITGKLSALTNAVVTGSANMSCAVGRLIHLVEHTEADIATGIEEMADRIRIVSLLTRQLREVSGSPQ